MNKIIPIVFLLTVATLAQVQDTFKIEGNIFPEFNGQSILLISFNADNEIIDRHIAGREIIKSIRQKEVKRDEIKGTNNEY